MVTLVAYNIGAKTEEMFCGKGEGVFHQKLLDDLKTLTKDTAYYRLAIPLPCPCRPLAILSSCT